MAQGYTIQAILKAISGSYLKLILSGEENRNVGTIYVNKGSF